MGGEGHAPAHPCVTHYQDRAPPPSGTLAAATGTRPSRRRPLVHRASDSDDGPGAAGASPAGPERPPPARPAAVNGGRREEGKRRPAVAASESEGDETEIRIRARRDVLRLAETVRISLSLARSLSLSLSLSLPLSSSASLSFLSVFQSIALQVHTLPLSALGWGSVPRICPFSPTKRCTLNHAVARAHPHPRPPTNPHTRARAHTHTVAQAHPTVIKRE